MTEKPKVCTCGFLRGSSAAGSRPCPVHRPVAEPAEPTIREEILAALPIKPIALLKKLSARGFKDEEAKLKLLSMLAANPPEVIMQNDQTLVSAGPKAEGPHICEGLEVCRHCGFSTVGETAAPQPVAGEGPDPYMIYGKTLMEIKMLIQQDDIRKSGTPKLEETLGLIDDYYISVANKEQSGESTPSIERQETTAAILRSFITPASVTCPTCHGKVELRHNKAGVWMQCLPGGCGRTWPIGKTDDLHPFITPACSPELSDLENHWEWCNRTNVAICGGTPSATPEEMHGCGQQVSHQDIFRCVDCQVPFHRNCLRKHFNEHAATPASTGEANGWISVKERLPEYDTDVHLWGDGWKHVYVGYWRHSHEWIGRHRAEDNEPLPDTDPTHWQPLPPAPTSVPQAEPPK